MELECNESLNIQERPRDQLSNPQWLRLLKVRMNDTQETSVPFETFLFKSEEQIRQQKTE